MKLKKPDKEDLYFSIPHFELWHSVFDAERTHAYEEWIKNNVKDKVVIDLGSGSGILCYLAWKYGAKKVYGIELSIKRAEMSRRILPDDIEIITGDIETHELPECDIYLHENFASNLVAEIGVFITERARKEGWADKIYPNMMTLYDVDIIEEERLQTKINPNTYEGGTQEFIELLELEGLLPDKFGTRLNTNIKINSKVWEGKFIDLYDEYGPALTRPDLNYLGWESSFDGKHIITNFSGKETHWNIHEWVRFARSYSPDGAEE